jgi:hypothetical protein
VTTVDNEFMINAIADAVLDALEANAALDEVQLFIRGGAPLPLPTERYPFCEVLIGQETQEELLTGELNTCLYHGLVTFTANLAAQSLADWLIDSTLDERRATVTSYDLIKRLVMTAQMELERPLHHDLGNLQTVKTLGLLTIDELVVQFFLDGTIVYGLDDRANNYENFGSIPFTVEARRLVTEAAPTP